MNFILNWSRYSKVLENAFNPIFSCFLAAIGRSLSKERMVQREDKCPTTKGTLQDRLDLIIILIFIATILHVLCQRYFQVFIWYPGH